MSVLEVGAGIGDHSHYYIDRGCKITITEPRPENLAHLRNRYPGGDIRFLDMDAPSALDGAPFDVVHCYGLLYHLNNPQLALEFLSQHTGGMLFLETCVSFGQDEAVNLVGESRSSATQAVSGTGCRPTRPWLYAHLKTLFEFVYLPTTQPCHEEFPLDWTAPKKHNAGLQRAIFIASRRSLDTPELTSTLSSHQLRQA